MIITDIRTVEINITPEQYEQALDTVGREAFQNAIGYLTTWSLNHPRVVIYIEDECDLVAVYKDETNTTQYVIGAVWHDDHYGFHS
jgi:hypothetical protein